MIPAVNRVDDEDKGGFDGSDYFDGIFQKNNDEREESKISSNVPRQSVLPGK